jgi:transcriptional regulator with XRE-family HTH domain
MDWKQVIGDIVASGLTQSEIARRCDTGQGHISALLNGQYREPRFGLGKKLLDLHRQCELLRLNGGVQEHAQ